MVVSWWLVGSLFIFLLFGSSLFSVQTCTYVSRKVILCPFSVQAGLLPTGNWWRLDTHADLQRTCKQVEISPRMPRPRWTRGRQVVRGRLAGGGVWRRARGTRDPTGGWGRRRSRATALPRRPSRGGGWRRAHPTGAEGGGRRVAEEDYFTRRKSRPPVAPSPEAKGHRPEREGVRASGRPFALASGTRLWDNRPQPAKGEREWLRDVQRRAWSSCW